MATRLYLPSSGTPPATFDVTVPLDFFADPYELFSGYVQLPCYTTKQNTSFSTLSKTDTSVNAELWYACQYISPPMSSTHLWGTGGVLMTYSVRMSENDALANFNGAVAIAIVTPGATDGIGGSPYKDFNTFSGGELGTSLASVFDSGNNMGATYTNLVGDRIVLLPGAFKNSTSSYTLNIEIGDNAVGDLNASDGDTGQDNPWVELSEDITFSAEPGDNINFNQFMMMGVGR